ncbi:MAG: FtsQ-type POTRA domain-containing protein, partial [Chloroflexota bacterium]
MTRQERPTHQPKRQQPKRQRQKPKQLQPQRKLRKQTKVRRVNRTASYAPELELPDTVSARRRHRRRLRFAEPMAAVQSFFTSPRWISGLILGLTLYCFYYMISTSNFYITVVPVEGLFSISANEIVSASDLAGRHIFSADPVKAAQMINDTPGIISTEVNLAWPNQVEIMVEEETPVAVWKND